MGLSHYLLLLRRRGLPLVLCVAAGLGGGLSHAFTTTKQYTATSRSLINISAARGIQDALAGVQLSSQLIATYAQVATSRAVADRVVTSLGLSESADDLRNHLQAAAQQGTFIIDIAVTDPDPARAALLADTAAAALSDTVQELESGKTDPIHAQLLDRAAVPTVPTSPDPQLDAAVGLILGLLAGIGLAFLLELLDRTVKTPAQCEELFGAPLLGAVPRHRGGLALIASTEPASLEAEAFRALRTAIRFMRPDDPPRVVLLTSAMPSDGKSTVAANLAITFAAGGDRVILVDADLRRATVTEYFGQERAVGISGLVTRTVSLEDAIRPLSEGLDMLPAGASPPLPAEILGSQAMANLLARLADHYDLVLVDSPPVLPVTDAVVLAAQVDAVVMIARHGKTTRHAADEAARRVKGVGARLAGVVFNAVPPRDATIYEATYSRANPAPTPRT